MEGDSPKSRASTDRLESWKAIATYLNRSVRTVRRWEQGEGLPVRRHRHEKGSTVFAYRSELDAWLRRGGEEYANEPEGAPADPATVAAVPVVAEQSRAPAETTRRGRGIGWIAGSVASMAAATLGMYMFTAPGVAPDAPLAMTQAEPGWVLVAEAEDRSDAGEYGTTLVELLEQEVTNNPALAVVPAARFAETQRLMRLEPGLRPDAATANEIALRDGNIDAVLLPSTRRVGDTWLFGVDIHNLESGSRRLSLGATAERESDVLNALRELAAQTRAALSAAAPEDDRTRRNLAKVTTSSLGALRLYSRAVELADCGHPEPAVEMLHDALNKDEEFPAAWIELARVLRMTGAAPDNYLDAARAAVSYSPVASEVERYMIRGIEHHLSGRLDDALSSMDALHSIDPNNAHANRIAVEICLARDGEPDCLGRRLRLARSAETEFAPNLDAAWALAMWAPGSDEGAVFLSRARAAAAPDTPDFDPERYVRMRLLPVLELWRNGDVAASLAWADRLEDELSRMSAPARDLLAAGLGRLELAAGRLAIAGENFSRIGDPVRRAEQEALLRFARGDMEGVRHVLDAERGYRDPFTVLLLSMSGLDERAAQTLDMLRARGENPIHLDILRARLNMAAGNSPDAVQRLRSTADQPATSSGVRLAGIDMLAMNLAAAGNLDGAIEVLERTGDLSAPAVINGNGVLWVMCQKQLASLYRRSGRITEAAEVERDLLQRLRYADADLPLYIELQAAHQAPNA